MNLIPQSTPVYAEAGTPQPELPSKFRVLLAEDSEVNRIVATRQLQKLNCEVLAVADGQAAVEALEHQIVDLILMDCQMPVLDGYGAAGAIRVRNLAPGARIVAITASVEEGERERCIAAGMDEYLVKPLRPQQLAELLQRTPKILV